MNFKSTCSHNQWHQWSSGTIHRCHQCDPGSIPGSLILLMLESRKHNRERSNLNDPGLRRPMLAHLTHRSSSSSQTEAVSTLLWTRHRPTEPGIVGSSPTGVIVSKHFFLQVPPSFTADLTRERQTFLLAWLQALQLTLHFSF